MLLAAVTVRVCVGVAGAGGDARQVDRLRRGEFSRIAAGLAIGSSVGGWLTGVTVTVKVCVKVLTPPLAVPPSSITVTVIVAVPLALAAGRVGERAGRVRAGVGDRRVGDQARVAAGGGDGQVLRLVAGAGGDARQVDRLRPGVLEDRRRGSAIGSSVGGWLTGATVDREGLRERVDAAVGGAAVVGHGDGDRRRAEVLAAGVKVSVPVVFGLV